jgi:hypothetical protein
MISRARACACAQGGVRSESAKVSTYNPSVEGFGANYPIHSNQMSEVSADFTFFPSIGRAPKPIISDVIFTDNFGNEHRVRTQFSYIGPKPVHEPPSMVPVATTLKREAAGAIAPRTCASFERKAS